ncbi:MAG TPA: Uma2 family endonuclease [Tepidisphaeraceae bacterium]|jgi:Uma2 family endonuclease
MTQADSKAFEVGTTGWTAADLDDPAIEREWFLHRYEIVEGVLTKMAAAYFAGSRALGRLRRQLEQYFEQQGAAGDFAPEADIVLSESRVIRADEAFLTAEDQARQDEASSRAGKADLARTRILVPPTLIIESVSPGHEQHDYRTKRRWYAEFGVGNYWILNAAAQTLVCLVLEEGVYRTDFEAKGAEMVRPPAFPGLEINLASLWGPAGK